MTSTYFQENTTSRQRLENLTARVTEADLSITGADGWTIAAWLAHLAFWDQRVLVLLRRWKADGFDPSPMDADAVNDSLQPLCLALEPPTAVQLCLALAGAVDAEIEATPASQLEEFTHQAQASGTQFRLNRGLHRNGHLNQIESLLTDSHG